MRNALIAFLPEDLREDGDAILSEMLAFEALRLEDEAESSSSREKRELLRARDRALDAAFEYWRRAVLDRSRR